MQPHGFKTKEKQLWQQHTQRDLGARNGFLSVVFMGLILVSAAFIVGCSSDDDNRITINERVSEPGSVFAVFGRPGSNSFVFANGLFSPAGGASMSETTLRFDTGTIVSDGTNSSGRFMTDPLSVDEPDGEGDADGEDSCNYQYDATTTGDGRRVPCGLCDIIVFGENVQCGGTSRCNHLLAPGHA